MTIRVLLVDDHPVVLDGLAAGLRQHGIEVTGLAMSLAQARAILAGGNIEVVLVDIRLPDGSGTELFRLAKDPGAPAFIVLSSFATAESNVPSGVNVPTCISYMTAEGSGRACQC